MDAEFDYLFFRVLMAEAEAEMAEAEAGEEESPLPSEGNPEGEKTMGEENEELEIRFAYREPQVDRSGWYILLHDTVKHLAYLIQNAVPECREKALALTKLEEAIFWANAGIARREAPLE